MNSIISISLQIIRTLMDKKIKSVELQQMADNFSDLSLFTDEIMHNIGVIQGHLQNDIDDNAKILDGHCDCAVVLSPLPMITENESIQNTDARSLTKLPDLNSQIQNKHSKRTPIDPQKKNKLLAALKSIDSSNDCI